MRIHANTFPDKARCSECADWFHELTILGFGQLVEAWLCSNCLKRFRSMLRRRRRPVNPRVLQLLGVLAESRDQAATETTLRQRLGRYSTNTVKSLCARGFAALRDGIAGETTYQLTTAGARALASGELEEGRTNG